MEFFEAPAFTRYVSRHLTDDEYREIQDRLASAPKSGAIMPGTGGFRKLRWADPRRGKGARGGLRIIYFHFAGENQIWMMTVYDKSEASDLTPTQRQALKTAIEAELQARRAAQTRQTRKPRR